MRIGKGRWFLGYYRVEGSQSWVLCIRAPKFGMMHLGHHIWWKPFAIFLRAFVPHFKLAFFKRPSESV